MHMWLAQYKNVSQFTVSTAHPNEAFRVSVKLHLDHIVCSYKTGRIKLLRCLRPFNYITAGQLPPPLHAGIRFASQSEKKADFAGSNYTDNKSFDVSSD